jgi:hypothetical protein
MNINENLFSSNKKEEERERILCALRILSLPQFLIEKQYSQNLYFYNFLKYDQLDHIYNNYELQNYSYFNKNKNDDCDLTNSKILSNFDKDDLIEEYKLANIVMKKREEDIDNDIKEQELILEKMYTKRNELKEEYNKIIEFLLKKKKNLEEKDNIVIEIPITLK